MSSDKIICTSTNVTISTSAYLKFAHLHIFSAYLAFTTIYIMIKKLLLCFIGCCFRFGLVCAKIQSPEPSFWAISLVKKFTPHYRIVDYFRYVAQASKNVKLQQFGTTNEGRPLLAMFIASPENIGGWKRSAIITCALPV
jgi:hypothetical protein